MIIMGSCTNCLNAGVGEGMKGYVFIMYEGFPCRFLVWGLKMRIFLRLMSFNQSGELWPGSDMQELRVL